MEIPQEVHARSEDAQAASLSSGTGNDRDVSRVTAKATAAAIAYIDDVRPGTTIQVLAVDAAHIRVKVTSAPIPVTLLQLAGVGRTVRAQAIGEAQPQTGITEPGQ